MRTNYLTHLHHIGPRSDQVTKISSGEFPSEFSSQGRENTPKSNDPATKSTALVPITPGNRNRVSKKSNNRQSAPLVAQLIATYVEMPQTRLRRRTSFRSADQAYKSGKMSRATENTGILVTKKV